MKSMIGGVRNIPWVIVAKGRAGVGSKKAAVAVTIRDAETSAATGVSRKVGARAGAGVGQWQGQRKVQQYNKQKMVAGIRQG